MVNTALQIIGFVVALIGWGLSITATVLPSWGKNDIRDNIIEYNRKLVGLWKKCQTVGIGLTTCDDYDSIFLGLPVALQAARAMVCLSIALGFFGTVVCMFGLNCTTIASDNPKLKGRLVVASGILHILGGALVGAAVSWFASTIQSEYYKNQYYKGNVFDNSNSSGSQQLVYGEALFVGWAAMTLSILAGLGLCCSSCQTEEEDRGHTFTYNPPRSKAAAAEYI